MNQDRDDAAAAREAATAAGTNPQEEVGDEAATHQQPNPSGEVAPAEVKPAAGEEGDDLAKAIDTAASDEQLAWAGETYGEAIAGVMKDAGVNAHAANEYFQKNGTLPDATFEKLAAKGYPKSVVQAYIKGVADENAKVAEVALAEQEANKKTYAFDVAGGQELYDQMTAWAASAYTKDEVADFDKAITSNDPATMRLAAQSLKSRFEAANGKLPARNLGKATGQQTVAGGKDADTGGDTFATAADMQAAMRDVRYGRDADYTRDVELKVVRSNRFGHVRRA
ncbi:hypothetical protein GIW81_00900 [Hyphomicrobium sp. xq]|uniref:Capsid assembly protein n=1 Tax=Hyphomicrobium album TaxID=2665159 RepID=A0A6I3KFD6_9HYPH|nr:hypothetical protein [Hyphomicrobium album]MTD92886.1 hypothetical protein [Hyphomicrobium album]